MTELKFHGFVLSEWYNTESIYVLIDEVNIFKKINHFLKSVYMTVCYITTLTTVTITTFNLFADTIDTKEINCLNGSITHLGVDSNFMCTKVIAYDIQCKNANIETLTCNKLIMNLREPIIICYINGIYPLFEGVYTDLVNLYGDLNLQDILLSECFVLINPSHQIIFYTNEYVQFETTNLTNILSFKYIIFNSQEMINRIVIKYVN